MQVLAKKENRLCTAATCKIYWKSGKIDGLKYWKSGKNLDFETLFRAKIGLIVFNNIYWSYIILTIF